MAENLSISRYTYLFVSSKKKNLVYNSRTNTFLEVSDDLYKELLKCKDDKRNIRKIDIDVLSSLLKRKIIVEAMEDDDFLLEHQYETDRRSYSKYVLGLTLVPTLGCNFSCYYCFEEHKRMVTMNEETEDAVIAFINSHHESRQLALNWYGGEPLMAINTIERLLDKISQKTTLEMTKHSLITNGYFINNRVLALFKRYPLTKMQVTLDGSRERHNSIRKTKTDLYTYDKIIENTSRFIEEFPNTLVDIRVNIERNNKNDYYQVAEELQEKWKQKNVRVYPGFLRIDNEQKTEYASETLNHKEIEELLWDARQRNLLEIPLYPQSFCSKSCAANRQCAYIVGPEGEVYKCWNDVSDPKKIVGNIFTNKMTNKTLLNRYIVGTKWYNDPVCKKCFFLPICSGACAWYTLRNKYENGKYNLCTCTQKAPGMLDKCLESYYDSFL